MMRRGASGVACALVAGVLFAGCGGSSGSGSPVPVNDVALVDGTPITVSQLVTTMNIARLSMGSSYP